MPAVSVPIMDSISTGALETMTLQAAKMIGPPVRDLRDLARQIGEVARDHFCYAQAAAAVTVLEDHLCAMARVEELNKLHASEQNTDRSGE